MPCLPCQIGQRIALHWKTLRSTVTPQQFHEIRERVEREARTPAESLRLIEVEIARVEQAQ